MSENKHAQNDALWNKLSPATVAAAATRLPVAVPYNAAIAHSNAPMLFGGGTTSTTTLPPTTAINHHGEISFAAARFQAPPIHQQQPPSQQQQQHTASSPHMATSPAPLAANYPNHHHHHHHSVTTPSIASSNVPVFPPTAAVTSVLTPNPFAAVTATSTATTPATLQQLFHAMNSAAVASLTSSATMGGSPLTLNTAQTSPQLAAAVTSPKVHGNRKALASVSAPDLPSPSSNSSGGVLPSTSGFHGGAISSTITENVLNAICGLTQSTATASTGRNMGYSVKSAPDEEKLRRVQQMIEANISEHAKQQIVQILDYITTLKPVEKLLLYLRLPGAAPETDPLRQPQNPLGTRSEINHTINWVRSHLEQDPNVSIPKQDVYNDYIAYCERLDIKPLSTADFGKVMKQVFPGIRPRRLGTRGHSRYCYAAMRKTTKLPTPQLPQIGTAATKTTGSSDGLHFSGIASDLNEQNSETWSVIKSWSENVLQVKVEDANALAALIKSGNLKNTATNAAVVTATGRASVAHKKFGNREAKEKRQLTDMGPLKKRRKKKRKGSTSSESSQAPPTKQSSNDKEPMQLTKTTTPVPTASAATTAPARQNEITSEPELKDEKMKLVEVKEEFIDIPNNQQHQHEQMQRFLTPTKNRDDFLQQQPQMLPINLAPEQRTVLQRAPMLARTFDNDAKTAQQHQRIHPVTTTYGAAAKNLVPKIMELAAANALNETTANASQPPTATTTSTIFAHQQQHVPIIKEEDIDEYNTANIICKKVRKAQQTKGVWQQQHPQPLAERTTAATTALVVPIITTSAASPAHPASPATQLAIPAATINPATPSPNYLMGPPAAASSTSPFAAASSNDHSSSSNSSIGIGVHLTPTTAKVASRNMAQLRAKRAQQIALAAAAAAAAVDANPTDDLPENLGLPRERVISICNMDKHELDDYLINGGDDDDEENDNSNDQDSELLQYFPTGDAEEKLNSSDAGKQRNPTTAASVAASSAIPPLLVVTTSATMTTTTTAAKISHAATVVSAVSNATAKTAVVGSASASLAFMSQKHQQQQHQISMQQQQQQQTLQKQQIAATTNATAATKRKIPPHSGPTTIKHCTFAPISPNINNSSNNVGGSNVNSTTIKTNASNVAAATAYNNTTNGSSLFASPGLTPPQRLRPKPALGKQQSLDIDLASSLSFPTLSSTSSALNSMHDPMIGATRRRRNYANVTSASAPPSPSLLHQQQQQQLFSAHHFQNAANQWQSLQHTSANMQPSTASGFLNDQNSLDLDLFGASAAPSHNNSNNINNAGHYGAGGIDVAAAFTFDEYVNETQRSQSVPLSQLQRIHSPPLANQHQLFQQQPLKNVLINNNNYNHNRPETFAAAENSLFCSENSSSQHSNSANLIKLEDVATDVIAAATDSTALLAGVDVSEILSSPEFVQNFTSIAQQQDGNGVGSGNAGNANSNIIAATTTCSSAGSSSGYSSGGGGAFTTFTSSGNIMSRSVPSTPLPHHQQNLFGGQTSISFYNQRRRCGLAINNNDELQLSPGNGYASNVNATHNNTFNTFGNSFGSRAVYDISKSMPTTPITTPSFCYSPEFNRDFLINGNTIDDSIGFGAVGGGGSDSLLGNGGGATTNDGIDNDEGVDLTRSQLNTAALLSADDVSVPNADDVLLGVGL